MEKEGNEAVWWIIGVLIVAGIGAFFMIRHEQSNVLLGVNPTTPVAQAPAPTTPPADIKDTTNTNNTKKPMDDTTKTITKADGLKVTIVQAGSGEEAKNGKTVSVHYTGSFADGKKFDSSLDRGAPFSFTLGQGSVIKGWDEGVLGMKVGEKIKIVVPPALGYGPNDYGPIPGNSTLYFDIELLGVK
jgi:peptidylprolyl isomerase